jgi:hypothetical protein
MITATPAMLAAIGVAYPSPGLYVELMFTTPVRLHDRQAATRSWNSLTWTRAAVTLSGLTVQNGAAQSCSLSFVDSDNAIAALCRNEAAGLAVNIWFFDTAATATGDPVQIFSGIMSAPKGGDDRRVTIDCKVSHRNLPVGMLAHLLPSYMFTQAKVITYGNGTLTIQPRVVYS